QDGAGPDGARPVEVHQDRRARVPDRCGPRPEAPGHSDVQDRALGDKVERGRRGLLV
ncbi:hypothetical protein IWQ57_006777, partial [Coemansia nantahalensis]